MKLASFTGVVAVLCLSTVARASHHLDSATAKADGRLNLTDLYVFPSPDAKSTVFVMSVGPDAGKSSPVLFHPSAFYEIDIDTNGDLVEDVRYRLRFSEPGADGHQHPELFRQVGSEARSLAGERLVGGANLGDTQLLPGGGRLWAGIAGDAFAANAPAYFEFFGGLDKTGKVNFGVFDKPFDLFDGRNVLDIVLEIPNQSLGGVGERLGVWGTILAVAPGETKQVSRWGRPLSAFLYAKKPEDFEALNAGNPKDDLGEPRRRVAARVAEVARAVGAVKDPDAYAAKVVSQMMPLVLPYEVGTPAKYEPARQNGRALMDDTFDVVMGAVTGRPLADQVAPTGARAAFPYVPEARVRPDLQAILAPAVPATPGATATPAAAGPVVANVPQSHGGCAGCTTSGMTSGRLVPIATLAALAMLLRRRRHVR